MGIQVLSCVLLCLVVIVMVLNSIILNRLTKLQSSITCERDRLASVVTVCDAMQSALEFYGSKVNWETGLDASGSSPSEVELDLKGYKARQALKRLNLVRHNINMAFLPPDLSNF